MKTVIIKGHSLLSKDGKNPIHYSNDTQALQKVNVLFAQGIDAEVFKFPGNMVAKYIRIK